MSTLREAAQQALEALDYCIEHSAEIVAERAKDRGQGSDDLQMMMVEYLEKHRGVITALRAALAQQKCPCGDRPADQCPGEWEPGCDLGANEKYAKVAEPVQPVAEVVEDHFSKQVVGIGKWASLPNGTKLYTTPPAPQSLRDLCAAAYQVVAVADGPVEMLDNLWAAAEGKPLPHDPGAGLPWSPPSPQPVAWMVYTEDGKSAYVTDNPTDLIGAYRALPLYTTPPAPVVPQPLTIEKLRDALVASRVIPPEAIEDPDNYDDGVMLHRIEALYRRIT